MNVHLISNPRYTFFPRLLFFLGIVALLFTQACSSSKLPPAQTSTEFYTKYRNEPGFSGTSVPVGLLSRVAGKELDADTRQLLSGVRSVRLLRYTPTDNKSQKFIDKQLLPEAKKIFNRSEYSLLPVDGPAGLELKVKEEQDKVKEMALYGKRSNGFVLLLVEGSLDQALLQKVIGKIDPDLVLQAGQ